MSRSLRLENPNGIDLTRKKMRRLHPCQIAKKHRVYSIDDVCELYDVSRNTPANWVKDGLSPIDDRRDRAFAAMN